MKLPNAEQAIISPDKLRKYLLSPSHPVGRFKAAFFRAVGYQASDWRQLDHDIRLLLQNESTRKEQTEFGQKYAIAGELTTPSGRRVKVITIWIVANGERMPRFVTAYPGD